MTFPVSQPRYLRRRAARSLMPLALAGLCLAMLACSPVQLTRQPRPPGDAESSARMARKLTRQVEVAQDIKITATLWDPLLLSLPLRDAPLDTKLRSVGAELAETNEERQERLARWQERFLADQTSFTVLLELRNRPQLPPDHEGDALTDPQKWNFKLAVADKPAIEAEQIRVLAIDRFPRQGKGWHWRVAVSVHFPGTIAEHSSTSGATPITLEISPPEDNRPTRWGKWLSLNYNAPAVPLRWRVLPPRGSSSSLARAR